MITVRYGDIRVGRKSLSNDERLTIYKLRKGIGTRPVPLKELCTMFDITPTTVRNAILRVENKETYGDFFDSYIKYQRVTCIDAVELDIKDITSKSIDPRLSEEARKLFSSISINSFRDYTHKVLMHRNEDNVIYTYTPQDLVDGTTDFMVKSYIRQIGCLSREVSFLSLLHKATSGDIRLDGISII